jgi:hypothetical protein
MYCDVQQQQQASLTAADYAEQHEAHAHRPAETCHLHAIYMGGCPTWTAAPLSGM